MSAEWVGGWTFATVRGDAAGLHARSAGRLQSGEVTRAAWVLDAQHPAVVLGSAEPTAHVDPARAAAAGIDVVRRRSGGGAVVVGPGRCVWVDLVIGRGDPLWDDDIGRAAWWVGDLWVAALSSIGVGGAGGWRGGLVRSPWSDRACFAGLGPGEVVAEGGKVVGVSQRRTRAGALFQCAALLGPEPGAALDPAIDGLAELVALQSLGAHDRALMLTELRRRTLPLPAGDGPRLVAAVRSALSAP